MISEIVHFVVQGEFITEQARTLWNLEGEPEKAMEILKCLDGISDSQCMDILEGRSKLIGDSNGDGVELVDDDAKDCLSMVDVIKKIKAERDAALDENADMIQMLVHDTTIVASPTGARVVPLRKTQRYGRSGGRRGLKEGYEFDDVNSGDDVKKITVYRREYDYGAGLVAGLGGTCSPIQVKEREYVKPTPPPAQSKITTDTGWLSPDGKFYPCKYGQHGITAESLDITDTYETEWVRICETSGQQHFFGEYDQWTQTQKDLVISRCDELKIERPWFLWDKALEPIE